MHSDNSPAPALSGNLELSELEAALAAAVLEVSRLAEPHVGALRRFALFHTAKLLQASPEFGALLGIEAVEQAQKDPLHLSSFELPVEEAEIAAELEQSLWPADIAGGLICGEIPTQEGKRQIFAAVLLSSECMGAVADPQQAGKLQLGRNVVPEITELLQASLGI